MVALLLGSTTPCKASEHGCNNFLENVGGTIAVVLVVVGLILVGFAWVWLRWNRGPFPWIMRVLGRASRRG